MEAFPSQSQNFFCDASITVTSNHLLQIINLLLTQASADSVHSLLFLAHISFSAARTNHLALSVSSCQVPREICMTKVVTTLSGQPVNWCLWIGCAPLVPPPPARDRRANILLLKHGTQPLGRDWEEGAVGVLCQLGKWCMEGSMEGKISIFPQLCFCFLFLLLKWQMCPHILQGQPIHLWPGAHPLPPNNSSC